MSETRQKPTQKSLEEAADAYYLPDCRPFGWQDNPVVRRIALALDAARQEGKEWQPIETMPEYDGDRRVFVANDNTGGVYACRWTKGFAKTNGVTHWMPNDLPAPPGPSHVRQSCMSEDIGP